MYSSEAVGSKRVDGKRLNDEDEADLYFRMKGRRYWTGLESTVDENDDGEEGEYGRASFFFTVSN